MYISKQKQHVSIKQLGIYVGLFFSCLAGCVPSDSSSTNRYNTPSGPETVSAPTVKAPTVGNNKRTDSELSDHAAKLAESVRRSQARLASGSSTLCPKLLEFSAGQLERIRRDERMKSGECRYYMYPKLGRKLSASITNPNMKVELVQPRHFDFARGSYTARNTGRHVIVVSYKQEYMPKVSGESYDIRVKTSYD